jgi:hypothetical protein
MEWEHAHHWCHFVGNGYYTYAVCYPNGLPFYVGKGKGPRMLHHGKFNGKREPDDEKEIVIAQLQARGLTERYAVLQDDITERCAFQIEAIAIMQWGRRSDGGMLANRDEGQLRGEPENWALPTPPQIEIKGNPYPTLWAIHPKIQFRAPRVRGVGLTCPRCVARFYTAPNEELHALRCPVCYHFFDVDNSKIYEYWRKNRHRKDIELEYPPPALCELPVMGVKVTNALSEEENPVEEAISQLVTATPVEPEPEPVAQEEKPSYALAMFFLGFICALALSVCAALVLR